ncbi:YjfB family protein [Zhenpiania hominis]|uniref:YjfB family protein n=1 Tax=Zhenpiania hominis TaxID=2763644 RepID=A0A923NKM4_9FIRM|nr:YjfB family protein [Zhenpiania hominis]MBC6678350.1 YjfB family protein [Zhenpiania hominis]
MGIDGIAAASISLSTASLLNQTSLSVVKKAMDSQEQQAAQLIQQLEQAVPAPPSNHIIDILA